MAISPIALQVNYSQLNHVGRDQAVLRNLPILQQSQLADKILEEEKENAHKVLKNEPEEPQMKLDQNQPDKKKGQEDAHFSDETRSPSKDSDSATNEKGDRENLFRDPAIGHVIDISG